MKNNNVLDQSNPDKWPYIMHPVHIMAAAGMGKNKTLELLQAGEIPGAKRVRGRWMITKDAFLEWFNPACHNQAAGQ